MTSSSLRPCLPLLTVTILLTLVQGCDSADDNAPASPLPVVEGWINSSGTPTVLFTTSIPAGDTTSIRDHMLTWAKVTISDGDKEVVMTGGPAGGFFPPFRYHTSEMTGVPGKRYRITADYKTFHAEAECVMPSPTPIDNIEIHPIENDSLFSVRLTFTAPSDVPAYYYISVTSDGIHSQPLPSMMGTTEVVTPGIQITLPVFRPRVITNTERYTSYFKKGERFIVSLNRVQPDVYAFWRIFSDQAMFGTNNFISTSESLPGNINGGLGIFSAQGASSEIVEITGS